MTSCTGFIFQCQGLESVHKNVYGFIPTDNTWEKVVNAVVYIFLINITTFTTLFSVTDIMSFLRQCKEPFYALKPVLAILAATSVAFAQGDGCVNQDAVSSLLFDIQTIYLPKHYPPLQWYLHLAVKEGHVSCRNCDSKSVVAFYQLGLLSQTNQEGRYLNRDA
jgi:hypothetical protein